MEGVCDKGFYWDRGLLRKVSEDDLGEPKYLLVVPTLFRPRVLSAAHDRMGHQSLKKVMSLINRNFTWPSAYSETKLYIEQCVACQRNRKARPVKAPMVQMPVVTMPFEVVAIDLVGPFPRSRKGYKYLLMLICLACRYPEAEPLRTMEAAEVADHLLDIFARHGLPRRVLSDQGTQFTSFLMQGLCKRLGVESITTTPFHIQANGGFMAP